ncbi:MAG TPA: GspH/FimT family pseudopilin [Usitatibacter sp.]|nr:GspH/FimT family pseudopilin [Usitatibacter sp.]
MLNRAARPAGFTLVEILITLAIIAMVIAFGFPSMRVWLQNTQLRNAADSILGGLQSARIEALKRNTTVAFELTDPNSTAWHVCLFDIPSDACSPGDLLAAPGSSSSNARVGVETAFTNYAAPLNAGSGVPALVAFDSFGRVSPSSPVNIARIDLRNPTLAAGDERRLSIRIETAGEVHMCDPQLSKAVNPQGCQ